MIANMRARLINRLRVDFPEGTIAEYVIWELPGPVPGSAHHFKYRFFFGEPGKRLIGYDNERGKGDHRHIGDVEERYRFVGLEQLVDDFWDEVARYGATRPGSDNSH